MGASQSVEKASPVGCPVDHSKLAASGQAAGSSQPEEINPRNMMPNLKQEMAPGQKEELSIQRTISSIPRAPIDASTSRSACPVKHEASASGCPVKHNEAPQSADAVEDRWEYPSSQQFYNALVRKGWETPEESVDMMVQIHNWLNEQAWDLILQWETKHPGGDMSQLAQFQGRPQDLSPKARFHLTMSQIFPNYYAGVKPFDRHDWVVHRPTPKNSEAAYTAPSSSQPYTVHRYVIDYYQLANDEEGNPVFSLDARPAVDSVEAITDRLKYWYENKKKSFFEDSNKSE